MSDIVDQNEKFRQLFNIPLSPKTNAEDAGDDPYDDVDSKLGANAKSFTEATKELVDMREMQEVVKLIPASVATTDAVEVTKQPEPVAEKPELVAERPEPVVEKVEPVVEVPVATVVAKESETIEEIDEEVKRLRVIKDKYVTDGCYEEAIKVRDQAHVLLNKKDALLKKEEELKIAKIKEEEAKKKREQEEAEEMQKAKDSVTNFIEEKVIKPALVSILKEEDKKVVDYLKAAIVAPSEEQKEIIAKKVEESTAAKAVKQAEKQAKLDELSLGDMLEIPEEKLSDSMKEFEPKSDISNEVQGASSKEDIQPQEVQENADEDDSEEEQDEVKDEVKNVQGKEAEEGNEFGLEKSPKDNKVEISWSLKSPSSSFNPFYQRKAAKIAELVEEMGILDFDKYQSELRKSSVDMSNFVFDLLIMQEKMIHVQRIRDRAIQIANECSYQYFHWNTFLKTFKGLLYTFVRAKPVDAQQGENYIHLGDVEYYVDKLEGIREAADRTLKNLDSAFETVSRQVTIELQSRRPIERFAQREQQDIQHEEVVMNDEDLRPKKVKVLKTPEEMQAFDELPTDAKVEAPEKKVPSIEKLDWSKSKKRMQ